MDPGILTLDTPLDIVDKEEGRKSGSYLCRHAPVSTGVLFMDTGECLSPEDLLSPAEHIHPWVLLGSD